tara:strand:- start:134 stop:352 length:219 start_codon:yes stop_codon:yes gene_type:complete
VNKVKELNEMLLNALARDLQDPDKCTPGLYTVVRGIVNDNREAADSIPSEAMEAVTKAMADKVPFKIKQSTY